MSYDLYCYKTAKANADRSEAEKFVEELNAREEAGYTSSCDEHARESIVSALRAHNPRLERFRFEYAAVAKMLGCSIEEAQRRWCHAELNPPDGDFSIQFIVSGDNVCIHIPYWYGPDKVEAVFAELREYLLVIRESSGFFVYDPQTGEVFDPKTIDALNHSQYDRVMRTLPEIIAQQAAGVGSKKPWWRFW